MVANINLIKQESYSVVNLEKQLSRTVTNKIITMSKLDLPLYFQTPVIT